MSETVYPRAYGVREINYYLRQYLAEDDFLANIAICGEISGYKAHHSGHIYFALREGDCGLKAVMFRREAATLKWRPKDGDQVIAVGAVALYERDGNCQLYVRSLFPEGTGRANQEREKLRRRLEAEGLFDPARKQPLPAYAFDLGVITAADSAAWADIRRIVINRLPAARIKLYPALVQGTAAPASLVAAIAEADAGGHQLLICGRGGGSEEDLAAFDQEQVVRAIASTRTPLISAVGHESDITLADLAADLRAATPTHAAALAVPDAAELSTLLMRQAQRLYVAAETALKAKRERLRLLAALPSLARPQAMLQPAWSRLDHDERALQQAARRGFEYKSGCLAAAVRALDYLDPLAVLKRGYALASDAAGALIRDAGALQPGEQIVIRPARGLIWARVEQTENGNGGEADGKSQE